MGAALLALLFLTAHTDAGLYYSAEKYAPLPAAWRGFLMDQRLLRNIAAAPVAGAEVSPQRERYLREVARLEKSRAKLGPDELADLGALHIRLGNPTAALEVLRSAQREHPAHFAIAANLATAWQALGDLEQATRTLEQAVRLAPKVERPFEDAHLRLVRGRLKRGKDSRDLDDFLTGDKRTPEAAAIAQKLGLWLPGDGPLLWQLGELAAGEGDVRTAAAILDGCVTQFGMDAPLLREHRRLYRQKADALPAPEPGDRSQHEKHVAFFRSRRPLQSRLDLTPLPAIRAEGVNRLPWELLTETTLAKKPGFPQYLKDLDGKEVEMTGFLLPEQDAADANAFLFVESPVGCWYCEMPELTGIVHVELPPGETARLQRGLMHVVGRLALNRDDPESFLFALRGARLAPVR